MCQIHIVYNKNKITKEDFDEFLKLMCFGSMAKNDDAWGIFNNKKMIKRSGKFYPSQVNESIINGKFLVGHNRLSTTGIGSIYNWNIPFKKNKKAGGLSEEKIEEMQHHPFKIGDFLLVHNGVIINAEQLFKKYKIESPIKTDSFAIIYLINHYFKLSRKNDRKEKIVDAIKKTSKQIEGWYSVILYDKKDDAIYYFRNENTTFNFNIINNKLIVGSSKYINLEYAYNSKQKKHIIPKKNSIYLIRENGDELITEVGRLCKSKSDGYNVKIEAMNEEPGELDKRINSLPGKPTRYEISENFNLSINYNKTQGTLLQRYFKSKHINFKTKDDTIIIKLGTIYNGN